MPKLSFGDLVINNQASDTQSFESGLSLDQMMDNINRTSPTNITPNVTKVIPIDRNPDGSIKYTFDNIYDNKDLASVARDYYTIRDSYDFESGDAGDREAIDKFISDRTWKQANSFSMGKEFSYITGSATQDQKARLAYLTREWDKLPDFYEEGGRGFSGFFANLGAGILDPINIIGVGVGGQVTKQALKTAGQQVIKSEIKKGVTKKTVAKELLNSPTQLANLSAQAKKNAILKGAGSMAAVDGAGYGTIDIANQLVEKEIGIRERLDPLRTGTIALTASGLGFFVSGGGGLLANKLINLKMAKNANLPTKNLKNASKAQPDNTNKSEALNSPLTRTGSYIRTNLADQWDFVKVLQKEITGTKGDVADLKRLYKSGDFKVDPILEPYFQLRTLSASNTRAHNFIMEGVYMPPSATAKSASYTKSKSKGLHEILKPFDKDNEVNEFLNYVSAKRQDAIAKRRPTIASSLPDSKQTRQQYIDFAELSADKYKKKYGVDLTRKGDFATALDRFKEFTDDLLQYQIRSGLIDEDDAKKILKENPYFIPLTREVDTAGEGIISGIRKQTQKVMGLARPGAKQLATTKQQGKINLYQNMVRYTYQTVLAGDRNRAKIAFYNMLQKGDKLGKINIDDIVKKVKANRFAKMQTLATDNVKKAYEKAGSNFDVEGKPNSIDVLTFSNTFKPTDGVDFVDVLYRNGKAEYYEIIDPNLAEAFKGLGEDAYKITGMFLGEKGLFTKYARFASQAITYSPPFVAFNVLRDTLAGTVNSAFGIGSSALPGKVGYIPGFTTAKGYIASVRQTQAYKEALLNGMGYASRSETEKLTPTSIKNLVDKGSKLGVTSDVTKFYTNALGRFIGKPLGYGWKQYSKLVQSAEYATRMGEYQLARNAGFSEIGAAFAGREVATDFGMRGSSKTLNLLNRNTMFLNASIQGLYRTGRLFREQPGRAAALIGSTIVAPSIALYHINSQYEEYSKVPVQIRQLNYLIPNFTTDTNGNRILDPEQPFYAIPKPYDLGVFANVAEGLLDGMYKGSDGVTKRYIASSFAQITPGIPIPSAVRPVIELMMNKNLYSGAPVIGFYEMQRLDELQARPSTREIAKKFSNFTTNLWAGATRTKEGAVTDPVVTPIVADYLLGAYLTGLMQYPIDIINARLDRPELEGEAIAKREDEADFSSFKNATSIVTRRFKVAGPIKNSEYHKIWNELVTRAKELKQIDITQLDLEKSSDSKIIGLFGRIFDKIDKGKPGIEPEVQAFSSISPILNQTAQLLRESRKERNNIMSGPFDAKTKRELVDVLISQENLLLKTTIDVLAELDIDFIFDKTFGLGSLILGTAEDSVKQNPREKK